MNDGAKFNRKVGKFAFAFDQAEMQAVNKAALLVKTTVQGLAGTSVLRNVGSGARIGVKYKAAMRKANPTALVYAYGPFHLIERDTSPHQIPKSGFGRGKAFYGLLKFPDGRVRWGPVHHPGTKGKRPFERGVEASTPVVHRLLAGGVTTALRTVFGG